MISKFLSLEWKSFIRSASFGKSLAIKIVMGFFALYFILVFLALGFGLYPILQKTFPDQDPFIVVNGFIFFWFLGDLLLRFFHILISLFQLSGLFGLLFIIYIRKFSVSNIYI